MAYTKQTWLDRVGTFLNRFTKSNESLTSVQLVNNPGTITQAGTAFSASRMNYMEAGIEAAHRIATPLSDLSRVMRINGDGVPIFPDNVAGTIYRSNFTVGIDSWYGSNVTLVNENGRLKITATATTFYVQRILSTTSNKLFVYKINGQAGRTLHVRTTSPFINLNTHYLTNTPIIGNAYNIVAGTTIVEFGCLSCGVGEVFYIDDLYIGSGLYDTPVYDKACCNRATNYAVLPVPGFRGQALRFLKISGLVFDNPVVGLVGTIYGRIRRETLTGATQIVCSNYSASPVTGINVMFGATNNLQLNIHSAGTLVQAVTIKTGLTDLLDHTFEIIATGTTLTPVFDGVRGTTVSGVLTMGSGVFTVGRNSASGGDHFLGLVHDIGFKANVFTVDEDIRYHNGDDAVDSQQKSVTPVPHSIVTRNALGQTQAAAGSSPSDVAIVDQVRTRLTGAVVKTVGSGGDFATLNAAKAWLETVYPGDNATLELRLVSGFVMAEQWLQIGGDYGWVSITSVSSEVTITVSALTQTIESIGFHPAFGVSRGILPSINALFIMSAKRSSDVGILLMRNSKVYVVGSKGVKAVGGYGFYSEGSEGYISNADFRDSFGGLYITGGTAYASGVNVTVCDNTGIYATEGAVVNASHAQAGSCAQTGILANKGANISADSSVARVGASDGDMDYSVLNGGIISANGGTGGVSQTANTITANGIIFK